MTGVACSLAVLEKSGVQVVCGGFPSISKWSLNICVTVKVEGPCKRCHAEKGPLGCMKVGPQRLSTLLLDCKLADAGVNVLG